MFPIIWCLPFAGPSDTFAIMRSQVGGAIERPLCTVFIDVSLQPLISRSIRRPHVEATAQWKTNKVS